MRLSQLLYNKETKLLVAVVLSGLLFSFTGVNKNSESKNSLFKIERSKDANQIFYDLSVLSNEKLDVENPINIYWIRNTEGGRIKPLTWIQQHYAYGLDYSYASENYAQFNFVSYDKKTFTIKKDKSGQFKVFTISNNKEVIVNRIYIQIDGGSFWIPKISRVELHTTNPKTQEKLTEIIKP